MFLDVSSGMLIVLPRNCALKPPTTGVYAYVTWTCTKLLGFRSPDGYVVATTRGLNAVRPVMYERIWVVSAIVLPLAEPCTIA